MVTTGYDGYQGSRDPHSGGLPPRDSVPMIQPPYQSYRGHYDTTSHSTNGSRQQSGNMDEFASLPPRPNPRPYANNNVIYGGGRPSNTASYDDYASRGHPQQQYSQQTNPSGYY